ncbi:MAG: N-6 DNA methylase [Candidatus Lokiarchaeota archaeon]|nr:N-6 DNA methylase [Candidatus Lokiarchaeota archaeon]
MTKPKIFTKTKEQNINNVKEIIVKHPQFKSLFKVGLDKLKILDPACGSGRFLLQIAKYIFTLYQSIEPSPNIFILKKKIIMNNIFGIDSDQEACYISKLRLFQWILPDNNNFQLNNCNKFSKNNDSLRNMERILKVIDFKINVENKDFLVDDQKKDHFHIIIGNPPYIENKKIKNDTYKKDLYSKYQSAYKLYDLSILFIERSLNILKKTGYMSFIITNKFLSSNYGVKLRELLIKYSKISFIINISSLPIFQGKSIYPIIIFTQNMIPEKDHNIKYKNIDKIENLQNNIEYETFLQKKFLNFPEMVIPLKGDLDLLSKIYLNYQTMEEKFSGLNLVYRPYGFTDYTKYFKYITNDKKTDFDLILLGTGNIGKYYIKFNKKIKIAGGIYNVSYINPEMRNQKIWKKIHSNKIIFREIAKELTCVYDPGVFTNITGLYFIEIPNIELDSLFTILSILNSKFMDSIFKALFGTLHMSGGYLRFNGSFIKKLPMPHYFPIILARLGKVLQFLYQLEYDYNYNRDYFQNFKNNNIKENQTFLSSLSEALIKLLYLSDLKDDSYLSFSELINLLDSKNKFFDFDFKFIYPYFMLESFNIISKKNQQKLIFEIQENIKEFRDNMKLLEEIDTINNLSKF